ncbi:Sec14 cytosolic factor [Trypanosoma rangeli]|uniref:Sec14 cytosolic factor n=1 Tax=Trypanosoma rangeli TaxID=5698 RepID=A0A422NA72_TRYRA|nr:Sec14 cytosolic factor [Trypanosoma rangeli]RNF02360.1 Sec14 cytosolic factor [Trypanosoma rangeli]|eukprot:RNF02360.1 Sec14 cytosolic factor [Trypanosoma rangeli]
MVVVRKSTYEADHAAQTRSGTTVLTEEHKRKNLDLHSRVADILPLDDNHKLSDCDLLYRFLIGRQWKVESAEVSLRNYIALRKEQKLNSIIAEQYCGNVESTASVLYGFDKDGLPVMWNTPDFRLLVTLIKGGFKRDLLRIQMQVMEKARFLAKERQVDRCMVVLDLCHTNISSVNSHTLAFAREFAKVMQEYYPEIMCRILVFNAGWAVTGAWKAVRPLLDRRVQDKVHFFFWAPHDGDASSVYCRRPAAAVMWRGGDRR